MRLSSARCDPRAARRRDGLGESILFWDDSRYKVVPSEGGHSDFAPHTDRQVELLRFMLRRYPQVSGSRFFPAGFRTLHEFIAPDVKHPILMILMRIPLRSSPRGVG